MRDILVSGRLGGLASLGRCRTRSGAGLAFARRRCCFGLGRVGPFGAVKRVSGLLVNVERLGEETCVPFASFFGKRLEFLDAILDGAHGASHAIGRHVRGHGVAIDLDVVRLENSEQQLAVRRSCVDQRCLWRKRRAYSPSHDI